MIKVEHNSNSQNGVTQFAFETNNQDDYPILDKLRVGLLGEHPIRGGYVSGNRLVIEIIIPEEVLPTNAE